MMRGTKETHFFKSFIKVTLHVLSQILSFYEIFKLTILFIWVVSTVLVPSHTYLIDYFYSFSIYIYKKGFQTFGYGTIHLRCCLGEGVKNRQNLPTDGSKKNCQQSWGKKMGKICLRLKRIVQKVFETSGDSTPGFCAGCYKKCKVQVHTLFIIRPKLNRKDILYMILNIMFC